jgi:hypothetical protein
VVAVMVTAEELVVVDPVQEKAVEEVLRLYNSPTE